MLVAAAGLFAARSGPASTAGPPRPVVLELFTSEGCSSCPPADRLLETLDRTQPIAGAYLIVLGEHVDYWNRLGWTDRFSSPVFTQRQQGYVQRLHLDTAYTPQLVVDGWEDVVGSDQSGVRAAIRQAEARAKTPIDLSATRSGAAVKIAVRVETAPRDTDLYVAMADDHAQSQVSRGENAGRTLRHVAIVRTLVLAGKTDARGALSKILELPLADGGGGERVIAFLQNRASLRILGAAEMRF